MAEDVLTISDGALIIQSKMPCECSLRKGLKDKVAWVPKLLIAIPNKDNPFIVGDNCIKLENTPYFVKLGKSLGLWYTNEDITKTIDAQGYVFIPGDIGERESIYTFETSFVPDSKDADPKRLDVNLVPSNSFIYSESSNYRNFVANVRIDDLSQVIYNCLFTPGLSIFDYGCEHSGSVGLASVMSGRMSTSIKQKTDAVYAIKKDLEEKLGLRFD